MEVERRITGIYKILESFMFWVTGEFIVGVWVTHYPNLYLKWIIFCFYSLINREYITNTKNQTSNTRGRMWLYNTEYNRYHQKTSMENHFFLFSLFFSLRNCFYCFKWFFFVWQEKYYISLVWRMCVYVYILNENPQFPHTPSISNMHIQKH